MVSQSLAYTRTNVWFLTTFLTIHDIFCNIAGVRDQAQDIFAITSLSVWNYPHADSRDNHVKGRNFWAVKLTPVSPRTARLANQKAGTPQKIVASWRSCTKASLSVP